MEADSGYFIRHLIRFYDSLLYKHSWTPPSPYCKMRLALVWWGKKPFLLGHATILQYTRASRLKTWRHIPLWDGLKKSALPSLQTSKITLSLSSALQRLCFSFTMPSYTVGFFCQPAKSTWQADHDGVIIMTMGSIGLVEGKHRRCKSHIPSHFINIKESASFAEKWNDTPITVSLHTYYTLLLRPSEAR